MAKKVKLGKEAIAKSEEIMAFHGYSSYDEMVDDLISREFEKIKSDDDKEEQADKLTGLGYIS